MIIRAPCGLGVLLNGHMQYELCGNVFGTTISEFPQIDASEKILA